MFSETTKTCGVALVAAVFSLFGCGSSAQSPSSDSEQSTSQTELPETKAEARKQKRSGKADYGFDICDRRNWYGDEACDLFCDEHDPACVLGPDPEGSATAHPIVLAHGFDGSTTNRWSFYKVKKALHEDGHTVIEAQVPPYQGPSVRAEYLAEDVKSALDRTGASKVNLVAHSMGGLDARYLTSRLAVGQRVASVTTIGTPHRGTKIADMYLDYIAGEASDNIVDAIAKAWGLTYNKLAEDTDMRKAMRGLSTDYLKESFNPDIQNKSDVYYQSWAGVSNFNGTPSDNLRDVCNGKVHNFEGRIDELNGMLYPTAPIVAKGPGTVNDGMVNVTSAKWGNFRGCIPADHYDQVGQISDDGVNESGFDHIRFYRNLAYDLAKRGF